MSKPTSDSGGVHINSGIPNRAFYLTAVEIGGYAWEKAGRIWYNTLKDKLKPDSNFKDAARMTYEVAGKLYGKGSAEQICCEEWMERGWNPAMNNSFTIYFEQSGGFMGLTISLELNDEILSTDEKEHVHILIEQANFFELQTDDAGHPLPDQLLYRISVETATRRHTITIYEHQVTAELQPLIRFLSRKARMKKRD